MITINNSIDSNYRAIIYYKGKFIGTCLNELAFLNVRAQVKREQDCNYSFRLIKIDPETGAYEFSERYWISKNGRYTSGISFELYWPSHDRILTYLIG